MDTFDKQVAALLSDDSSYDNADVRRMRDFAAAIPRTGRSRGSIVAIAATAILGAMLVIVLGGLQLGAPSGGSPNDLPVLAADPRFALCGGDPDTVIAAFPIPADRSFSQVFPNAGRTPEVEGVGPTFVVVFEGRWHGPIQRRLQPTGESAFPLPSLVPGHHDVCVWVGEAVGGQYIIYGDVDTRGINP